MPQFSKLGLGLRDIKLHIVISDNSNDDNGGFSTKAGLSGSARLYRASPDTCLRDPAINTLPTSTWVQLGQLGPVSRDPGSGFLVQSRNRAICHSPAHLHAAIKAFRVMASGEMRMTWMVDIPS